MSAPKPLTAGTTFGAWTLIESYPNQVNDKKVACRCTCGTETRQYVHNLKKSTGCRSCQWKRRGAITYYTSNGYRLWSWVQPDGQRRSIGEHRIVMEWELGRELFPGENVHHINGHRNDNRLENLELWSVQQPAGQRVEDKTQWALEWLARYAPEKLA